MLHIDGFSLLVGLSGGSIQSFPLGTLPNALCEAKILLTGWPHSVRVPGDKSNTKASYSGLKRNEVLDLATDLHRQQLLCEAFNRGKSISISPSEPHFNHSIPID